MRQRRSSAWPVGDGTSGRRLATMPRRFEAVRRLPKPDQAHPVRCVQVIGEGLFHGVLNRERKRASRSNQPLFVLLLTCGGQRLSAGCSTWDGVIQALAATTRETDVVGWVETGNTLGVVLTEVQPLSASDASELASRVRRELENRLAPEATEGMSVQVHADLQIGDDAALQGAEPLPPPLIPPRQRAAMHQIMKRGLDVVGSVALLTVASPLFLVLAALVKLTSRGPVFFKQARIGHMAKPFTMLKFRSMRVNADIGLHQKFVADFIKSKGAGDQVPAGGLFKLTKDPRLTPVGRILRKTSLDELPQLWNVLRGEMSLVGPRPPLHYEVVQYQPWHRRRLFEAKPGLTGLWQVTGRSRTTFDDMVRLDLRYAKTSSLSTDLKILLATPAAVIVGKGAC
jgi:lipopolysaccharide/colanic/teichoic acid biosynthesis glycosyltransferase